MLRGYNRPPAWVHRGAILDFDFENERYWGGIPSKKSIPEYGSSMGIQGLSAERLFAPDRNGKLYGPYPANSLRIANGTGLWVEKNTVCSTVFNRDLTNAMWVKTNITATRDQAGQDVNETANTGTRLTATGANATCLQSVTRTIRDFRVSAYVKRVTGTGVIEMTVDGGSTWVDVTSQIGATDYALVSIPYQNLANPQPGFRIVTSGDEIAVDFFQCQDGRFVDTPVIWDGGIASRGNELATFNTTGTVHYNDGQRLIRRICMDTPSSYLFEFSGVEENTTSRIYGSATLGEMYMNSVAAGAGIQFGNTNLGSRAVTANAATYGGAFNKAVGVARGTGCKVCLNGGAVATNTGGARYGVYYDHIGFGNNGGSTQAMGGCIKRMTMWDKELDNGEMQRLTT